MMKDTKTEKDKLHRYLDDFYTREEASQFLQSIKDTENPRCQCDVHKSIIFVTPQYLWHRGLCIHMAITKLSKLFCLFVFINIA